MNDVYMGSRALNNLHEFIAHADNKFRSEHMSFEGVLTLRDTEYDPVYLREIHLGTFRSLIEFDPETRKHYASPLIEADDDE